MDGQVMRSLSEVIFHAGDQVVPHSEDFSWSGAVWDFIQSDRAMTFTRVELIFDDGTNWIWVRESTGWEPSSEK